MDSSSSLLNSVQKFDDAVTRIIQFHVIADDGGGVLMILGAFGRNEDVESLRVQSPTPKSLRQQLVLNTWPLLKTNAAENGFKMFQT